MSYLYRCSTCGKQFEITPERMVCDTCFAQSDSERPPFGLLEVTQSADIPDSWDIFDMLPVERQYFPSIPVGNTPMWNPERLRKELNFPNLFLKDDTVNPTGSLKDRASFLVSAFALKHNIQDIVVASTGNAGSSMAGIGAAAGLNVRLYLPASAPQAKLIQAAQYGAEVVKVKGTYDAAYDECMNYVEKHGGLSRNTGYNPLTIEGKKTVSIEIFQQLDSLPDYVFVPTGDGVILSGVYKGFEDLKALSITDRIPTIVAVQAEGSSAITRALESGSFSSPLESNTVADSISVDVPRGGQFALTRLQKHGGKAVTVTDNEILSAQKKLSSTTGLFAEPAAAAAFAGFLSYRNSIPQEASVVLLITGNGLKDVQAAHKALELGI